MTCEQGHRARHLVFQRQERTTVPGQPAEEEPRAWRRGADIQAGPLQGQGHTAHLPHQALPVPRGRLPGEGPHTDATGYVAGLSADP